MLSKRVNMSLLRTCLKNTGKNPQESLHRYNDGTLQHYSALSSLPSYNNKTSPYPYIAKRAITEDGKEQKTGPVRIIRQVRLIPFPVYHPISLQPYSSSIIPSLLTFRRDLSCGEADCFFCCLTGVPLRSGVLLTAGRAATFLSCLTDVVRDTPAVFDLNGMTFLLLM